MTEDYISFETAKLLKEKGFDEPCEFGYISLEEGHKLNRKLRDFRHAYSTGTPKKKNSELNSSVTRPTQALALKWLRIEHHIHIHTDIVSYSPECWIGFINYPLGKYADSWDDEYEYPSTEEATEAAILYTLKNIL